MPRTPFTLLRQIGAVYGVVGWAERPTRAHMRAVAAWMITTATLLAIALVSVGLSGRTIPGVWIGIAIGVGACGLVILALTFVERRHKRTARSAPQPLTTAEDWKGIGRAQEMAREQMAENVAGIAAATRLLDASAPEPRKPQPSVPPVSKGDDLDSDQIAIIQRLVDAHRKAPRDKRKPFVCSASISAIPGYGEPPDNYTVRHAGLPDGLVVSRYDLDMLAQSKCITPYKSFALIFAPPGTISSFDVTAAGFDLADRN